ncbi:hypothetical protein GCM10023321_81140 [Pseudonocardia eucalypti]|uniref:Uncharacterized protein n=1 Tax=Pseudonocardia eucalypti TaxID=648755 RepID=A0ABP9RCV5_9PSEU
MLDTLAIQTRPNCAGNRLVRLSSAPMSTTSVTGRRSTCHNRPRESLISIGRSSLLPGRSRTKVRSPSGSNGTPPSPRRAPSAINPNHPNISPPATTEPQVTPVCTRCGTAP